MLGTWIANYCRLGFDAFILHGVVFHETVVLLVSSQLQGIWSCRFPTQKQPASNAAHTSVFYKRFQQCVAKCTLLSTRGTAVGFGCPFFRDHCSFLDTKLCCPSCSLSCDMPPLYIHTHVQQAGRSCRFMPQHIVGCQPSGFANGFRNPRSNVIYIEFNDIVPVLWIAAPYGVTSKTRYSRYADCSRSYYFQLLKQQCPGFYQEY